MPICAIYQCSSEWQQDGSVSLFGLPSIINHLCDQTKTLSSKRRALWLSRINRNFRNRELTSRSIKVCHKHFVKGKPSALFDHTNPDWAPSLNLGYGKSEQSAAQTVEPVDRYARAKSRQSKRNSHNEPSCSSVQDIVKVEDLYTEDIKPLSIVGNDDVDRERKERHVESLVNVGASEKRPQNPELLRRIMCTDVMEYVVETKDFGYQADMHVEDETDLHTKCSELFTQNCHLLERISSMESQLSTLALGKEKLQSERDSLSLDNIHLRGEILELRTQLKRATISEKDFEDDNEKTQFYTGLPSFDLLKIVYKFTESYVAHSHRNALPKFTEFLMTMMRLRLGCLEQDMAYRFHVTQSTVSTVCSKWITAMTTTLSKLIVWPERSVLCQTMPACFQDVFGDKVAVIIDCLELSIVRSSSLRPRAEVKFLIGITPQGTVSFVSNGYIGRASGKHITLASGVLDKLLPGDVMLADRGFDIDDEVSMRRAILAIPAFTKGKDQLSFDDVQKSREIANVRIHVERLIGCIKQKFLILGGSTLNHSYLSPNSDTQKPSIDGIVKICCALTNLCPPLVPDEKPLINSR